MSDNSSNNDVAAARHIWRTVASLVLVVLGGGPRNGCFAFVASTTTTTTTTTTNSNKYDGVGTTANHHNHHNDRHHQARLSYAAASNDDNNNSNGSESDSIYRKLRLDKLAATNSEQNRKLAQRRGKQQRQRRRKRAAAAATKRSNLQIGISAAQMLLNDNKRTQLEDQILSAYPLLPASFVESTIDVVATAFTTNLPQNLKQALTPGGMRQVRPELQKFVVDAALEQDVVRKFPILSKSDKAKAIAFLVDIVIDRVLEEASWVLETPQNRLEYLEDEIQTLKQTELTKRQVAWFYIQRQPVRYATLTTLTLFLLYAQIGHAGSWPGAARSTFYGARTAVKILGTTSLALFKATGLRLWIFLKVLARIMASASPSYGKWTGLPFH